MCTFNRYKKLYLYFQKEGKIFIKKNIKMSDTLTIPQPNYVYKTTNRTSCDCPTQVFKIKYLGVFPQTFKRTIEFSNNYKCTIKPGQYQQIYFNILVQTSLPGFCIVYGDEHLLYPKGLSYVITQVKTNDIFLYITIKNNNQFSFTIEEDTLSFYCTVVIPTPSYVS